MAGPRQKLAPPVVRRAAPPPAGRKNYADQQGVSGSGQKRIGGTGLPADRNAARFAPVGGRRDVGDRKRYRGTRIKGTAPSAAVASSASQAAPRPTRVRAAGVVAPAPRHGRKTGHLGGDGSGSTARAKKKAKSAIIRIFSGARHRGCSVHRWSLVGSVVRPLAVARREPNKGSAGPPRARPAPPTPPDWKRSPMHGFGRRDRSSGGARQDPTARIWHHLRAGLGRKDSRRAGPAVIVKPKQEEGLRTLTARRNGKAGRRTCRSHVQHAAWRSTGRKRGNPVRARVAGKSTGPQ